MIFGHISIKSICAITKVLLFAIMFVRIISYKCNNFFSSFNDDKYVGFSLRNLIFMFFNIINMNYKYIRLYYFLLCNKIKVKKG